MLYFPIFKNPFVKFNPFVDFYKSPPSKPTFKPRQSERRDPAPQDLLGMCPQTVPRTDGVKVAHPPPVPGAL